MAYLEPIADYTIRIALAVDQLRILAKSSSDNYQFHLNHFISWVASPEFPRLDFFARIEATTVEGLRSFIRDHIPIAKL